MKNNLRNSIDVWEIENSGGVGSKCSSEDSSLKVNVEGFEGPLDILLELSRKQKVDLARISILALAEQYLKFITQAREPSIELAADYLVMAAWPAFLKSKLLLPVADNEESNGEGMVAQPAFRPERPEAMRQAGHRLFNRNYPGRDFFARGIPETMAMNRHKQYGATLYDLLVAYGSLRQRQSVSTIKISGRSTFSLREARKMLMKFMGGYNDWESLDSFFPDHSMTSERRVSMKVSSFWASPELVREGVLALHQTTTFLPLFVKFVKRVEDKSNLECSDLEDSGNNNSIAVA